MEARTLRTPGSVSGDEAKGTPIGVPSLEHMEARHYKENNIMMSFSEYVKMRTANEGLWLNDKNAVVGLSRTAPPKPPKKTRPPAPAKVKPVPVKPVGEARMPDAVSLMNRLGIVLLPPRSDETERLVEKDKQRLPRRVVRTPGGGVTLAPQAEPDATSVGRASRSGPPGPTSFSAAGTSRPPR